jgi:hypothetical protein
LGRSEIKQKEDRGGLPPKTGAESFVSALKNLRDIRISKSGVRNKVRIPKCVGKVLYRLYLEVKLRKGRSSPWTISERRVLL